MLLGVSGKPSHGVYNQAAGHLAESAKCFDRAELYAKAVETYEKANLFIECAEIVSQHREEFAVDYEALIAKFAPLAIRKLEVS